MGSSELAGRIGRKYKRQDSRGKAWESTRKTFIEVFGGYVSASGGRQDGDKSRR
jgi:chorismate synthase